MSTNPERVIEAERIVLWDSQGNKRAEIGGGESTSFFLKLFDRRDQCRVEIVVGGDGAAAFQLWDASKQLRVLIAIEQDRPDLGTPTLSLMGRDGRSGLLISLAPNGSASIDFVKGGDSG